MTSDLEDDPCTVVDTYLPPALSSSSVHLSARLWSWVWIFSRSRVSAVAAILSPSARIISTVGRRSSNSLCSSWRRRNAGFGKDSNSLPNRGIRCWCFGCSPQRALVLEIKTSDSWTEIAHYSHLKNHELWQLFCIKVTLRLELLS